MSTKHEEKKPNEKTELAAAPPDATAALALAMTGGMETGFEETSSTDFLMPMLILLQSNSPQVNPAHAKYVPGAQAGQFLDMSTKELLPSVSVIPCLYKTQMVEWKPNRGGYAGTHDPGVEQGLPRNEKNQAVMPSGNLLVDTRYFYCLRLKDDGSAVNVIVALTSTEIPTAKDLMSTLMSKTIPDGPHKGKPYPIYLHKIKITSVPKAKAQHSWFGWKFTWDSLISQKEAAMLIRAQEARTMFVNTASRMKPVQDEEVTPGDHAKDANAHL